MIIHLDEVTVQPETYADYRPLLETRRINATHVRVWPGETVPLHTHSDEDQVYFVVTGEGVVQLGREMTPVKGGSAVLIPIGTEHALTNTGSEPLDYVFFVVFVPERP